MTDGNFVPMDRPVAPMQTPVAKKPKRSLGPKMNKKMLIALLVILAVLALGGVAAMLYMNNKKLKQENARLANPQEVAKLETEKLTRVLGASIELPNETPTIATVVDAAKLKAQAFFANAQNGDKVFLFPEAKKAILFRPSTNKIIEVAPINIGENATGQTNGATQTTPTTPTKKP